MVATCVALMSPVLVHPAEQMQGTPSQLCVPRFVQLRPELHLAPNPSRQFPAQSSPVSRPHEIKFDGYRVIARKDGERVRLWARTTSDYSKAFTRIRDAVAALLVDNAVIDGEAVVLRPEHRFDFDGLRSREGQAEAILVAYDLMQVGGEDVRGEPPGPPLHI